MDALNVLKRAISTRRNLVYIFAPSLIKHIPVPLIQLFIQMAGQLNPSKLLPALALT